ncbi:hypothetical protein scyTo_0024744, partial [Scyliorhinus torazame]|nr:hypothetical protein [Scyliorhinus torazame]
KLKRCRESDLVKEEDEGDSKKSEDEDDLPDYDSDEDSIDIEQDEEVVMFPKRRYTGFQGLFLYPVWQKMKQIIFPGNKNSTAWCPL